MTSPHPPEPQPVAIVTGAASGIGRATASRLAAEGFTVAAADITRSGLDELVDDPASGLGAVHPFVLDITDPEQVEHLVRGAQGLGGRLTAVCNVAGILDAMTPVHELEPELWQRVIDVNLTGPFLICREALPTLRERGGSIVNVASLAGIRGGCAGAAYTASKHGLVGLTRNIAWMYAADGIRCNAVCPGGVNTAIGTSGPPRSELGMERLEPVLAQSIRRGEPSEIADVIAYLISDQATLVNGAIISADAGWSAG